MSGRIINGTKHIGLCDPNEMKDKSLICNVYYTLRDIIWNTPESDVSYIINNFISELHYDPETNESIILDNNYKKRLHSFLSKVRQSDFEFTNDTSENEHGYLKLEAWWLQLQKLVELIQPPRSVIIINSSSYQFHVSYDKQTNKYFICGIHGFQYQCEDDIGETCDNALQLLECVQKWIPTWFIVSVVTYTNCSDDSELICSRVFTSIDQESFKGLLTD